MSVNAGRVAIVPKGEYVHGTQYTRLDSVRYKNGVYVAKKDNKSQYPTIEGDNEYWMFMIGEINILPIERGGTGNNTGTAQYLEAHAIDANTDLNTITTPGLYYALTNSIAQSLLNCPTSQAFSLEVIRHYGVHQIITEYPRGIHKIYERNSNSLNEYGDWYEFYTTANPPSAIRDDIPVEQRRNTFRGKNLGNTYTEEQKAQVKAGTFKDLFIGDYWVINGFTWRIVDINYWLNTGDTACTTPHLVIMPDLQLYTAPMNDENTTQGGYVGSKMYKEGLNQAKEMVNNAFGSDNILNHREYLINTVTNGIPSNGAWFDSTVELPNEIMMYGSYIFSPANNGIKIPILFTVDKTQLSLMQMHPRFIDGSRKVLWMRDVVSNTDFANLNDKGNPSYKSASNVYGVRVVFGLTGGNVSVASALGDEAEAEFWLTTYDDVEESEL